jgi:hypothetical protein
MSISAFAVFVGSEGCTVSTKGVTPNSATGIMFLIGSNAGLCRAEVAEKLPDIIINV